MCKDLCDLDCYSSLRDISLLGSSFSETHKHRIVVIIIQMRRRICSLTQANAVPHSNPKFSARSPSTHPPTSDSFQVPTRPPSEGKRERRTEQTKQDIPLQQATCLATRQLRQKTARGGGGDGSSASLARCQQIYAAQPKHEQTDAVRDKIVPTSV